MNRALLALLASFAVASALSESLEPTKVRITTWNLEWFPNGSARGRPALRWPPCLAVDTAQAPIGFAEIVSDDSAS